MADRAPLDEVVTRLLSLRDAGRPAGEAAQAAAALGWKPEEIKGALASAPPGWLGSLTQGATFGFGDEIRAGVQGAERKLLGGEDFGPAYADELGKARAAQALFQHAHPVGDVALQVAGGLPYAGAVGGAASVPAAIGKGALTGAAAGALTGAGTGTDPGDRAGRALFGGVVGAGVGGIAAPLVEGLVGAGRMQAAPGAVARQSLARAVADEGMTPATAAQAVADANAAGKTGVGLADVMQGGRVSGLLTDVAQSPNPAQAAVRTQIGDRQAGQFERVIGDLGDAAGVGGRRAVATANQLMEDRARDAAGDFAQAWTFDTASSPEARAAFAGLMHTDAGPRAYQRAATIARNEMPGAPVPKLDELVDENGVVKAMPNMQFLHYLKMGLDDLHSSAVSGGETGMGKTVARSIAGVRNSFRDQLAAANPAYGTALGRFSGYSAFHDALELGRQAITQSPDEFADVLHGLGSPGEQEMFRVGAVSKLNDMLGGQARGPTADLTRKLRSIGMEQKLPLLIGDPNAADLFARRLGLESAFSDTARRTMGNSATSERRELADLAEGNQAVGDLMQQLRGASGPTSFLMGLFDHTIGKLAKPMAAAFKGRFRGEMGGMLGRTDDDAVALMRELARRGPAPAYRGPQAAVPGAAATTNALLPQPQPDPWAGSGIALGR